VGYTRQALAQAPDDAQVRGRLLERLGRYHWEAGEAREAVQARQDAVELLAREPASAPYARALAALATGRMLLGEPAEAMRVAGRAVAAARAVADPAAETHALATLGVLQAQAGDPDTGLSTLEHSAAVAEELGSVEDVVRAAANRCYLLCTAGRFAEAVDVAQEGRRVARRSGAPPAATAILDNNTAAVLVTTGQWQRAGTFLDELLAEGSAHVARLQLLQLELAVGEGRRDLVGPLVAAILEGRDDPRLVAPVRACLAEAALFDGDLTAAARAVLAGLDALRGRSLVEEEARLLAAGCRVTADLAALPGAALSGAALSGAALSGTASDRLPPGWATAAAEFPVRAQRLLDAHGEAQPETAAYAACALAEARRAGREDDRAGWRAVAARWHRAGQPYRESYARLREAESTARAGRRDQAARALAACVGLAEQLPAAPLLALAHTLAARARIAVPDGADPVGSGPTGAPGAAGAAARHDLTDRELQVLARLAGGDSNRQIARALYISERTVAVHVGHILDKLNVRNRTEAAAAAAALDLSGSGPTAPDQKGNT